MLLVFGLAALQWAIAIQQLILGQVVGNNPAPSSSAPKPLKLLPKQS